MKCKLEDNPVTSRMKVQNFYKRKVVLCKFGARNTYCSVLNLVK